MDTTTLPHGQQSKAVNDALHHAVDIIQRYSNDELFLEQDPDQVFQSLDAARDQVNAAWKELQNDVAQKKTSFQEGVVLGEQEIRIAFMDMITDAFSDALESLRNNTATSPVDVQVLADCLQSGMDMMATPQSVADFSWLDDDDEDDDMILPHERNRQELGYASTKNTATPGLEETTVV